jgi:hypothetical protein
MAPVLFAKPDLVCSPGRSTPVLEPIGILLVSVVLLTTVMGVTLAAGVGVSECVSDELDAVCEEDNEAT